jgi:hypothetical protein
MEMRLGPEPTDAADRLVRSSGFENAGPLSKDPMTPTNGVSVHTRG